VSRSRRQPSPSEQATLTDLAHLPEEPRIGDRCDRLLHRADGRLPHALRVPRADSRPSPCASLQRDRLPTAAWTAQQIVEAFPWSTAPRYLLRDRDGVFGDEFRRRVKALDIEEVLTAPRSPWQNPFVERIIGSIRRECLDHVIIFSEAHLRRILAEYFDCLSQVTDPSILGQGRSRASRGRAARSRTSPHGCDAVWAPPPLHAQLSLTNEKLAGLSCRPGLRSLANRHPPHLSCGGALRRQRRRPKSSWATPTPRCGSRMSSWKDTLSSHLRITLSASDNNEANG